MKANVTVKPGWLEIPQNRRAFLKMLARNGRYLVRVHEGRVTSFAHVPPDTKIKDPAEADGPCEDA